MEKIPAGGMTYTMEEGDCLSSISERVGHFWQTLWNHPNNAQLAARRDDPNVLAPGDQVFIPPLRVRGETCTTDATHRFRRLGVPARLRMQLWHGGAPRAGQPCTLTIDGVPRAQIALDQDGRLDIAVPSNARKVEITFGEGRTGETLTVLLGHLDPVTSDTGVRARLANLGLISPSDDDDVALASAVRSFQLAHGLATTGTADPATRSQLVAVHGS